MFKTVITGTVIAASFVTLITLGMWQVDRLEWKSKVLEQINAFEAIDITQTSLNLSSGIEYNRGYIQGRFLTNKPPLQLLPRTHEGVTGYHLIMPFQTVDGTVILVNQGFVANTRTDLPLTPITSNTVAGFIKKPDTKNTFTPVNRPDDNQWYWMDMGALEQFYGQPLHKQVLYMQHPQSTEPLSFETMPHPRNKHFQYAVFWFGMAFILALLLVVFNISRQKQQ